MDFLQPVTWTEALEAKAAHPDAVPIAGGTDVMVGLNFGHLRPALLLDLTRVADLRDWAITDGAVRLGAGVSYARVISELGDRLPGLAMASRTIGSPQIRNRGTVAGNLATASPAGDAHPALLAAGAEVEVASVRGTRRIPIDDFYTGVKRNAMDGDELITAVHVVPPSGPQQYSKIGTRNAMVISVAAFGLALHPDRRAVGTGIGSAAPTPRRAPAAEEFLAGELDSSGLWESRAELPEATIARFGELVAAAAAPIDDVRGSARYRVHALSVMARRALTWAWADHRSANQEA
ncbi:FAD binding domain-containing protein [Modestobacter sp. VKM Ac-2979]|uniref:FAD binding domain-containing protein n=1 Tax=unclassified Modestobacter TaxID=2643866 RepID=UPI0022ABC5E1|nr:MULTISPECIES: FAD binding domain-containing protein [unclassified Modestobacter]MCZ2813209.1 FAD binding domain-containing protein [Modestobacter sp. VKM Ac-2979]MCZ2844825.1 FAD binding domain-containing protein [Modestobacter sp. VKM Ac-2980]